MRTRSSRLIGCFVAAAAVAWLASDRPAAQAPNRCRRNRRGIPRMPDGRPDLQGIFNVATITPVDRPGRFGNRLVLTDAEAAAMEQYEVQRNEKDRAPSAADRTAPPVGGDRSPTEVLSRRAVPRRRRRGRRLQPVWINPGDRSRSPWTARNALRSSSIPPTAGCRR